MRIKFLHKFIQLEASGGIALGIATLLALILANSSWQTYYQTFLNFNVNVGPSIHFSFLHFINDGLMTIFFFLVSLEIKRELVQGELNTLTKALLPALAAIGGMLVPALCYLVINHGYPQLISGWAIPMATDIAFSLGVLSLLGKQIPVALKIFLMALAIIDDLGAIIVIATFYTQQIGWLYLFLALLTFLGLILLNYYKIQRFLPYCLLGISLWLLILNSGIHATIAGVLFGFTIPLNSDNKNFNSLLHHLIHQLHPWIAYGILPLFAFANAGLSFSNIHLATFLHPLPLGIIVGLFFGKQVGIFGASWLAVKTKLAKLPYKVNWWHIYGTALICGVGFTMSLFIAGLAFRESELTSLVRLGVFTGSILSGIAGYCILLLSRQKSIPAKMNIIKH
ncbi:Na+/H+ antiporter NhaA [Rickettsiella endosymbiont of Litargus connexus]|jgi:NhaA family Na+:H+ antiporter|uniref:Na+/H+ antiporter NhaA n=1 Tax=Rickettsiella endosymbiont of Litargus connexus TaxID=3066237 RepID=UPI0027EE7C91|nr:Na+/H+ antiporter NhaA [Gammaproteobacteria bacterium]MDD4893561.1 Na+/H+ antiporter NhaA [Candidatus Rickettsiella isopodorum]MDD5162156.1 Na+/H+ antiporter NhaA [Candidatus Rickettsiella isopodorum]MDQ5899747.1 Na+:H+ antiporter, NhaA family [Pseudomonadota bacterium]